MVREAVLEGDVMAKRAGILVESRFFCPFLEYQLFFKAHVIGGAIIRPLCKGLKVIQHAMASL
jgi:hypothetical protein